MDAVTRYFTSPAAPTLLPHTAIGLFIYSHAFLSTRFKKMSLKLDHNVNPRQDLDKYGQVAVVNGKITQAQLDELYRREGAHQNATVHLPVFLAALAYAQAAGIPNATINKFCLVYTLIRVGYGTLYVNTTSEQASFLRSLLWWASNFTVFTAFWQAGKRFSHAL